MFFRGNMDRFSKDVTTIFNPIDVRFILRDPERNGSFEERLIELPVGCGLKAPSKIVTKTSGFLKAFFSN